jgi:hypothetical protein
MVKGLERALQVAMPGCAVLKHNDASTAGIPDLSVTWRGKTAWIEVKFDRPAARASVSALQKLALRRLGGYLAWYAMNAKGIKTSALSGPCVELTVEGGGSFALSHAAIADKIRERLETSEVASNVRAFHEKFGFPARRVPTWDEASAKGYVEHLYEKAGELRDAQMLAHLPEIADALADIVYIAYGTATNLGIPLDDVLRAVHCANMEKTRNCTAGEKSGMTKPKEWRGPDVEGVLKKAGWRG